MICFSEIMTPLGKMTAGATDDGLFLLDFQDRKTLQGWSNELKKQFGEISDGINNQFTLQIKNELAEYFTGKRKTFEIQLAAVGTDFQLSVWEELKKIPYGVTISYTELAENLGKPESIRAIANANGKNKIAIVVPCHRVIGANGKLTGYSGGLHRKKWLIEHEKKHSGKPFDILIF